MSEPVVVRRRPMAGVWLARLAVLAVLGFVVLLVIGAHENNKSHTIGGDFLLDDNRAAWTLDAPCVGVKGYEDVSPGLPVTVTDGSGKVIGTGALGVGVADGTTTCSFPISVPNVPQVDFYTVTVGTRGSVTKSKAEMAGDSWQVELSLGH